MVDAMTHNPAQGPARAIQVFNLTRRLSAAVRVADWDTVRVLDEELSRLLPTLSPAASWSHDLKVAMSSLRLLHRSALIQCAQASEDMAARLADMRTNKDGWLAYAANSEWNESAP